MTKTLPAPTRGEPVTVMRDMPRVELVRGTPIGPALGRLKRLVAPVLRELRDHEWYASRSVRRRRKDRRARKRARREAERRAEPRSAW